MLPTCSYATRPHPACVPIYSMHWPNSFCQRQHFWGTMLCYPGTSTPAQWCEHHPTVGRSSGPRALSPHGPWHTPWQGLDLRHGSSWSLCRLITPRSPQFSKLGPRGLLEGRLLCSFLKLILLLSLFMLFSANISLKIQACSP